MNEQASIDAEATTEWARERTRLANERTFAAIVRTALALIGSGVAVARLLPDFHIPWVPQVISVMLIVGGGITIYWGSRSTHNVNMMLHTERGEASHWRVRTTTMILILTAVLALFVVGLD
jgi:putative membrane protein